MIKNQSRDCFPRKIELFVENSSCLLNQGKFQFKQFTEMQFSFFLQIKSKRRMSVELIVPDLSLRSQAIKDVYPFSLLAFPITNYISALRRFPISR